MGRRPRAASVSGDMRHKALPHGGGDARTQPSIHEHEDNPNPRGGDARQPRRRGRQRARSGRQARRGTAPGPRGKARVRPHGGAHPGPTPHGKAHSAAPASRRMRFSVTLPPGRRGTKPPASLRGTMENASTGQMRSGNPPPGCGGVAPGTRRPRPGARPHGKAQSVFWFNKNCAVPIWEPDGLPCTIHLHDVVAISSRHTKTGMQATRGEQRAGRVVAAQAPTT